MGIGHSRDELRAVAPVKDVRTAHRPAVRADHAAGNPAAGAGQYNLANVVRLSGLRDDNVRFSLAVGPGIELGPVLRSRPEAAEDEPAIFSCRVFLEYDRVDLIALRRAPPHRIGPTTA